MKVSKYSLYRKLMFAHSRDNNLVRGVKNLCDTLTEAKGQLPDDEFKDLVGLFEDKASKMVDVSFMRYTYSAEGDTEEELQVNVRKAFTSFVSCTTRFLRCAEVFLHPDSPACKEVRRKAKAYSTAYKTEWEKVVKNMK